MFSFVLGTCSCTECRLAADCIPSKVMQPHKKHKKNAVAPGECGEIW